MHPDSFTAPPINSRDLSHTDVVQMTLRAIIYTSSANLRAGSRDGSSRSAPPNSSRARASTPIHGSLPSCEAPPSAEGAPATGLPQLSASRASSDRTALEDTSSVRCPVISPLSLGYVATIPPTRDMRSSDREPECTREPPSRKPAPSPRPTLRDNDCAAIVPRRPMPPMYPTSRRPLPPIPVTW